MTGDATIRRPRARFPLRIVVPLALMGFVAAATSLSLSVERQHIAKNLLREAVRDLRWQATRLQATLERAAIGGDQEAMQEAVAAQGGSLRCRYAALVDQHGKVLSSMRVADVGKNLDETLPQKYGKSHTVRSQQLRDVRESRAGIVAIQDVDTVMAVQPVLFGARSKTLQPTIVGNLILIDDIAADKAEVFRGANRAALVLFSLLTLFAGGLGVFFHVAIAQRLRSVMQVAEQVTEGKPVTSSGVRGNDEVGHLAAAIDEMIATKTEAEKALREGEERLRAILNTATDAIITIDSSGRIQTVNRATEILFGYSAAELVGQNIKTVMPQPYAEEHDGYIARYLETGEARIIGRGQEVTGKRKDGSTFPIDLAVSQVEELGIFTGIVRDITQRKEAEQALRREQELADNVINTAPAFVLILDTDARVVRFNPYVEKLTGWRLAEVKGKDWFDVFLHQEDHLPMRVLFKKAIEGETTRSNIQSVETKDGRELEIEWYFAPLTDEEGQTIGLLCIGQDVSERRLLERELLDISAEEQRRIGQDLHDGVGQELTGLGMTAHALTEMLATEATTNSLADAGLGQVSGIARQLSEGIGRTTAHVRQLSHGLVPVDVDAQGLMAALSELVSSLETAHDVRCTLEQNGAVELADNFSATHLFRIAQEAINNALRHSHAKQIRVGLADGCGRIVLSITDDGVGLPDALPQDRGMGLRIMRYRADLIGAELSIEPAEGGGTRVSCSLGEGDRERLGVKE